MKIYEVYNNLNPLDGLRVNRVNADNSTTTVFDSEKCGDIPFDLMDKEVSDLFIIGGRGYASNLVNHRMIEVEYEA